MLRFILASSLKFRFLVVAGAAAMVYFGMDELRRMPVDVFPEFAPPMVEVQTISLGLAAAEVEALVTIPLEQSISGTPGVTEVRSKSVPDLSAIKVYFEPGSDLVVARQLVQERLQLVTMPTWASPPVLVPPLSATSRMMKIGISSEKLSVIDLSMITYWTIRQRLLRVPGVANVAIWGERIQMLQVQADPERMREHAVQLDEIESATAEALEVGLLMYSSGHVIGTGGWVETPNQRLPIRHVLPLIYDPHAVSPDHLANIVLRPESKFGRPLLIKDVADVVVDHQPMIGDGIVDDGVGLLLIVEKFPWGNTLRTTRGVEEALDAMRPGLPDVKIDHEIFRPATYIETSIHNLGKALLIAAILVVLVLFVFLNEWRVALISCTAIPLSLVASILVLHWRGTTVNTMVLAGLVIALGAVVDDAIVDVENILRRLRGRPSEGRSVKQFGRIILEASFEVRKAILNASAIEIMALAPIFFMHGLSGAFFKPLAYSYALAIAASTVVALTVTPAMSFLLLRRLPEKSEPPVLRALHRAYSALLVRIVRSPVPAYALVGVIALVGIAVTPKLGQELLPSFKERDFLMHWLTKPGTSWPEMDRITIRGSKELRQIPGVRNFGAHIGQALIMDEVVGVYFGENWVSVDPSVDYDETVAALQATVDGYPGLFRDVLTYLKERIREVLTGSSDAVVVRIYGQDLRTLSEKATELRAEMAKIEGIIDLHVSFHEDIPHVEIKVDLDMASAYGLKPGDVRRAAATLVAGIEAGDIHTTNRTYDVNVWSTPETRHSLTSLYELPIDFPGGGSVPLAEIADVRVAPTPNVIKRINSRRTIDVDANVKGRDLGSVYADVKAAMERVEFPLEYYPELLGEYTERLNVEKTIFRFSILALVVIFLLLHSSFSSARLAAISFVLLPAALVGGVLAAYLSGGIISLGSLVGFLTVLGISARNGILMVNHFQHLETEEGMPFGIDLVLRGARERLAPILMTATTTGLALVPLALRGQIPGHEIEHPMAMVILGGLLTSTLLNLLVIPSLYLRFGKRGPAGSPVPERVMT